MKTCFCKLSLILPKRLLILFMIRYLPLFLFTLYQDHLFFVLFAYFQKCFKTSSDSGQNFTTTLTLLIFCDEGRSSDSSKSVAGPLACFPITPLELPALILPLTKLCLSLLPLKQAWEDLLFTNLYAKGGISKLNNFILSLNTHSLTKLN